MKFTAAELAKVLKGSVDGDPNATVTSFAKIESGKQGQLCFFANPKYEHYVYTSRASILLVNNDFEPKQTVAPTMIRVENAYAAIAQLLKYVSDQKKSYRRHRGLCSSIAWSARLGRKVYVGDFTHIGRNCRIGDYTKVYENVYIGEGTVIGSKCILYPGVRIYPGMVIGDNVILHANCVIGSDGFGFTTANGVHTKVPQVGNVVIEDDVEIGAHVGIDRAAMGSTIIGHGTKIDNLVHIAHNCKIGANCLIVAQTGISGSTTVGDNVTFGGQVGTVGHITIGSNSVYAARSGISKNMPEGFFGCGFPIQSHSDWLKHQAALKRVPELIEKIRKLEQMIEKLTKD